MPVSLFVWWFWGAAFCGEDGPTQPTGAALCTVLVEPIWPWAFFAATPTLVALIGGLLGLVLRRPSLYRVSLAAPIVLGVLTFFLVPALF